LETGRSAGAEREVVRKNGERKVLRIQAYPVILPVEGATGFVEYVSDITLRRKMEEDLKRHATHLEEIVRERTLRLREAQEQMIHKEKIAALGQMAAGVAHEIGNPLSSLSSIVRSLAADPGREGGREEKLRLMQEQIDRIARIVRELVDFSRPSSFGKSLMHANEVLRTAMGIARYDERFQGVHVITSLDNDIPALKLDGDQLLQVFLNILLNAADAMKGSGTLTVSSRRMDRSVTVSFGDSGPGIAEESLSRIFEPFYTTKDVGKGAGLGLSVSYGIIQGMGGSIRASNQAGKGALFTVEIPLPDTGVGRG
jgi:C4-dicarboxylate-specific signal transduction histidine kinase